MESSYFTEKRTDPACRSFFWVYVGSEKMSKTDIWMPIYIGDYLSATSRLSTEQHGAYLLLLMDYWKNGPPPDDDRVLAQIARMHPDAWSISRGTLQAFFDVSNGHWNHSRVERELEASKNRKAEATKKAHIAAEARWGKKNATSIAQALPEDMLGDASSPSSSPSSLSIPATTTNKEPRKRVVIQKPDSVSQQVWHDWLTIRKSKKAALTQTAWELMLKEVDKAGWTIEAAIDECCLRTWASFKASWVNKPGELGGGTMNKQEALEARNKAIGEAWLREEGAIV